jgi:hypothetical protein
LESRRLLAESQVAIDEAMKSNPRWNRRATLNLLRAEAEELVGIAESAGLQRPSDDENVSVDDSLTTADK